MRTTLIRRITLLQAIIAILCISADLSAQSPAGLSIGTGSSLIMNGPAFLVLSNAGFTNNGTFIAGSSHVLFTGSPGVVAGIGGNTPSSFYHLTLNNTSQGTLMLDQSISVTGNLSMQTGNLSLNGHDLDLSSSGQIIGENEQSHIYDYSPAPGSVTITRKLYSPQAVNPGNIGIEITSSAGLGSTRIIRHFDPQPLLGGGTSIARWFTVSPANNRGLNASARIHYLDAEVKNGNTAPFLDVWTGSDLMDAWLETGGNSSDPAQHWVQLEGIGHFNRLTLANTQGMIDSGGTTMRSSPQQQNAVSRNMDSPETAILTAGAYPNPTHNNVVLLLTNAGQEDALIGLYDQSGRPLQRRMVHLYKGSNTISWNLDGYPAGVYLLVSGNRKFKIVKH